MEFITLLLIIFLFAILFLVYKYLQTIRDANIIRNLGLKGKNLCDQLPFTFVFDFARCQWQPYLLADYYYKKYGRVHGGFLVSQPALTVGDPEILKQILVKDFAKFHDRFVGILLFACSKGAILMCTDS